MADRNWVGGGSANTWAAVTPTNWAATSGGANNASVPGVGDRAIFDSLSGSGNSVIGAAITVQALVCTGYTGTITHNSPVTLTINTASVDSLILSAAMTYTTISSSSQISFTNTTGTADITSNGKRLGGLIVNAVGGTVRLLDALRVDAFSQSAFTFTAGTFNGNTFAVTANAFAGSNSNTRVLQLGDGLWTVGGAAPVGTTIWNLTTITGLTFTKGATNIVVPSNVLSGQRTFIGGTGLTYNNLTIDANSAKGLFQILLVSSFNQINVGAGNTIEFPFGSTVISTAPTWTGTLGAPILVVGGTGGNGSTLSIPSGTLTLTNGGVRDMVGSGGANFVADNSYDFGGNTGWAITPPAAQLTAADIRAAVGLASANLDTQLDALPTNAELATALGTADDAVLVQVALVKAKTDSLTFTKANELDVNIQSVNDVTVTGNGSVGTPWGP